MYSTIPCKPVGFKTRNTRRTKGIKSSTRRNTPIKIHSQPDISFKLSHRYQSESNKDKKEMEITYRCPPGKPGSPPIPPNQRGSLGPVSKLWAQHQQFWSSKDNTRLLLTKLEYVIQPIKRNWNVLYIPTSMLPPKPGSPLKFREENFKITIIKTWS